MIRVILVLIFMFASPLPVWSLEEQNLRQYNEVVEHIAQKLMDTKANYPELSAFTRDAVREDPQGFKTLVYSYQGTTSSPEDPYRFEFSLRSEALEAVKEGEPHQWLFPLLGFKVVLEITGAGSLVSVDLPAIIQEELQELHVLEQELLPLRLEVSADKESYAVDEPLVVTVSLKNYAKQSFRVADLDGQSLFCRIGDLKWGGEALQDEIPRTIIAPGQTLTKILRVRGIEEPKEAYISCRYALGFHGVQPFNRIKISVRSDS